MVDNEARKKEQERIQKQTSELLDEFSEYRARIQKQTGLASENMTSSYLGWSMQKLAALQLLVGDLADAIVGLHKEVHEKNE